MKIALGQISPHTGNIPANQKKILSFIAKAKARKARLLIFPEMALVGYPPLDLVKRGFFLRKNAQAVKSIHRQMPEGLTVLLGAMGPGPKNSVFVLQKNQAPKIFSKEYLADYNVFDEQRYFKKGKLKDNFFILKDWKIQVLICEEMWKNPKTFKEDKILKDRALSALKSGVKEKKILIVSLNASPFFLNKDLLRKKKAGMWAKKNSGPFVYVNTACAQEELIFDGGSFILNQEGKNIFQSPFFKEDLSFFFLSEKAPRFKKALSPAPGVIKRKKAISQMESLVQALFFGLKEFAEKNGFRRAHLGLSGGLDSALTALLAGRAFGTEQISLLFLPGPFTSALSEKCARKMADFLNRPLIVQDISILYSNILKSLNATEKSKSAGLSAAGLSAADLSATGRDITKQNIQARLRCLFLMAYGNSRPESLPLSTSNKSELSLGYGTLYGDLAGGIAPLGDLFKSEVIKLASYLKIPPLILNRKASAELRKNQTDEQDLPPYKTLDPVLRKLMEKEQNPENNFEKKILKQLVKSEFKRRQAPPILKVKERSFDRGWRLTLSTNLPF